MQSGIDLLTWFSPSFTKSYTLHRKCGVSKPVVITDSCAFTSWFTYVNLQCASQTDKANKFDIWHKDQCLCMLAFKEGGRGILINDEIRLYLTEGQNILLLLLWVCLHMTRILLMTYFGLQAY